MGCTAWPGTRPLPGTPGSSTDPISVHSQPLLWLWPAGRGGHGEPGQELDHGGTSEEMRHRHPHGAKVRAAEPRRASPSILPTHGPTQEHKHLWFQGGEWGGSPGLSCPQDPRPSSCESLGRVGEGAFQPSSAEVDCRACLLLLGPGWAQRGCGRAGALRFGSCRHSHPQTEGLFRGQTEAPFSPAWLPLPQRNMCRVSCAAGVLPGGSRGGGGGHPWAWMEPQSVPAAVPRDLPLPILSGQSL